MHLADPEPVPRRPDEPVAPHGAASQRPMRTSILPMAISRSERLARRALGFALEESLSIEAAAELLLRLAGGNATSLRLARARILAAASDGPTARRAARALWTALQNVPSPTATSPKVPTATRRSAHRHQSPRSIVVIGPPGAGTRALGLWLAERLGFSHVSTEDLLRIVAAEETPLGFQAQVFMDSGRLVPDTLVVELLDALLADDGNDARGCILDGFPRTLHQAAALDQLLDPNGIDLVFELVVPTDVALARLRRRAREDASATTIARRLQEYQDHTLPVLRAYGRRGLLRRVDGDRPPDVVTAELLAELDQRVGAARPVCRLHPTRRASAQSVARPQLVIDVTETDDEAVVRLCGELDLATAPELRDAFAVGGDRNVRVDLSDLHFIDAVGIGVLAAAASNCRHHGTRLVLCQPSPIAARVLTLCGLAELVEDAQDS